VFVVKYGKTNSKMAQNAIDKIQKAGIKILGGL
jgi:Mrp family chromosome partitioning ATPase